MGVYCNLYQVVKDNNYMRFENIRIGRKKKTAGYTDIKRAMPHIQVL